MDSARAKQLLLLHRPWDPDEADPEMKEAFAQAQADPELGHWFRQYCGRQEHIRQQFREIPVPTGLGSRIAETTPIPRPMIWWTRPSVYFPLAAAASLLLLATLFLWKESNRTDNFAAYRQRMVRQVQRLYTMDMMTNNIAEIRSYLAQNQGHPDYVVPAAMRDLSGIGCAVLRWRGKNVSLVCLEAKPKADLYLFVIERSQLPDPPAETRPQFQAVGKLLSVGWSQNDKTYVLAGEPTPVRTYFP